MTYQRTKKTYASELGDLYYHHYRNADNTKKGTCLLLLHGSRLAGLETWDSVTKYLDNWSEIIVPDLPGVGSLNPLNTSDSDFTLHFIINYLISIINLHRWECYNIVSYSFGGLLSPYLKLRQYGKVKQQLLIESALMVAPIDTLQRVATKMDEIADLVITDPNQANNEFTKVVAKSKRVFNIKLNSRPIANPMGFANLLRILSSTIKNENLDKLFSQQVEISQLITDSSTQEAKKAAKLMKNKYKWQINEVLDSDHSVVFTKPKQVADIINSWKNTELA